MNKSESLYKSVFYDSSLGMMLLKRDSEVLMCNREVLKIFRQDKNKINNHKLVEIIYKDDVEGFYANLLNLKLNLMRS